MPLLATSDLHLVIALMSRYVLVFIFVKKKTFSDFSFFSGSHSSKQPIRFQKAMNCHTFLVSNFPNNLQRLDIAWLEYMGL